MKFLRITWGLGNFLCSVFENATNEFNQWFVSSMVMFITLECFSVWALSNSILSLDHAGRQNQRCVRLTVPLESSVVEAMRLVSDETIEILTRLDAIENLHSETMRSVFQDCLKASFQDMKQRKRLIKIICF